MDTSGLRWGLVGVTWEQGNETYVIKVWKFIAHRSDSFSQKQPCSKKY